MELIYSIGLSAAKLLFDSGLDVVVLEAQGRAGGRTFTVRVSTLSIPAVQKTNAEAAPNMTHTCFTSTTKYELWHHVSRLAIKYISF